MSNLGKNTQKKCACTTQNASFIELCLLPQLLPFNGSNLRSVIVFDNASIHHIERATSLIEEMGALVVFLPPYSPDLMPIEELFSKFGEGFLRANDPYIQNASGSEFKDVILAAFVSVTPTDCYSWFEHCGYIR